MTKSSNTHNTVEEIVADLWYQYPPAKSAVTMSKCFTCDSGARSGHVCTVCLTEQLAKLTSISFARRFNLALIALRTVEAELPDEQTEEMQTAISHIWKNAKINASSDVVQPCPICKTGKAALHCNCLICSLYQLKPLLKRGLANRLFNAITEVVHTEFLIRNYR